MKPFGKFKGKKRINAIKTVIDGITFDSEKESKRYLQLKELQACGQIMWFRCHEVLVLVERPSDFPKGTKLRGDVTYIADFIIQWAGKDKPTIEDVKTFRMEVFILKWKILQYKYYKDYYFNMF